MRSFSFAIKRRNAYEKQRYDSASFEAKKMIVSQLIRRVEVYRGYQIHVDFNFDLAQYLENSDELAC